jgi:hypothetical protein
MRQLFSMIGLVVLVAGVSSAAAPPTKQEAPKPAKTWSGRISASLAKKAPKRGYLVSDKAFTKLWKTWKIKEARPEIDFTKEIVLVATARSKSISITTKVDKKGDLDWFVTKTSGTTRDAAYQFLAVPRESIKTVKGKAIAKRKTKK